MSWRVCEQERTSTHRCRLINFHTHVTRTHFVSSEHWKTTTPLPNKASQTQISGARSFHGKYQSTADTLGKSRKCKMMKSLYHKGYTATNKHSKHALRVHGFVNNDCGTMPQSIHGEMAFECHLALTSTTHYCFEH